MRLTRWSVALVMVMAVVSCDTSDQGLSEEVSSLRDDVSALQEAMATMPDTATTTSTVPATTTSIVATTSTQQPPESTTTSLPPFPPEFQDLTQGGDTWVVILGVSEAFSDPALMTAVLAATDAGYTTGPTDCDFGAAEVLGLLDDRTYYTVSVYLSSEEDAMAAQDAFAARGVGGAVGEIQTFCLD